MKRNQFLLQRKKRKARNRPISIDFCNQSVSQIDTSRNFLDKSTRNTNYRSIIIKNLSKKLNQSDDNKSKASFCIGKRSNTQQNIQKYITISTKSRHTKSFTQNNIQAIKAKNIVKHLKQRKILLQKQQSHRFGGDLERKKSFSFGHKKKFKSFQLKWKNRIQFGHDALEQSIKKFNETRKPAIFCSKNPKLNNMHKCYNRQFIQPEPFSKKLSIKFKQKKSGLCPWQSEYLMQELQISLPIINKDPKSIQQWENVEINH